MRLSPGPEPKDVSMKGVAKVIGSLNQALGAELGAVDEYWLGSRLLSNWGYKKLAHCTWRDFKKDHRKSVRMLLDRLLFLEGTPTMVPNGFVPGTSLQDLISGALNTETAIRGILADGAAVSDGAADWGSEDMFEEMVLE